TGGKVELLLVKRLADGDRWVAMGRASKSLRSGAKIEISASVGKKERSEPALIATIERRDEAAGLLTIALESPTGRDVAEVLEALGRVPLPPYLRRDDDASDRVRYQTVFARIPGAVAAPTAGLHLSEALLERMAKREIELAT